MIKKGLWIGTATGFLLGLILWIFEYTTGKRVYTLLLNVDFIPVMGSIDWPIYMEWLFHLIIAWSIAIVYVAWVKYQTDGRASSRWATALVLTAFAALTYFPLTDLAIKETPAFDDLAAISYWLIAHLAFGVALVKLDEWTNRKK